MSSTPKISVIIPLYNVEKCVEYMLESVINQTYENIELILVDDGSKDHSLDVAEKVLNGSELKWSILKKQNGGAASARNYGIRHATGDWIICPDSDDYFAPQMLQRLIETAEATAVKCVFTNYQTAYASDIHHTCFKEAGVYTYPAEKIQRLFLERKLQLISPGMLIHKSICNKIHYNEHCLYDEDVYYVWETLYLTDNIAFIDSNYYLYITREGSTVHSLKAENYLYALEEYRKLEKKLMLIHPQNRIIKCILPKYKLGGLHVLAKNVDYYTFKETIKKSGYRNGMSKLIMYPNVKLVAYALIYCLSRRIFYMISKGREK